MHMGVRLCVLDLTRATEQTAVMMSLWQGRISPTEAESGSRKHTHTTLRGSATRLMLSYLTIAPCHPTLIPGDEGPRSGEARQREEFERHMKSRDAASRLGGPMEFRLSALDGARALASGSEGGSLVAIAGGPPGTFVRRNELRYFGLVLGASLAKRLASGAPNAVPTSGQRVYSLLQDSGVAASLLRAAAELRCDPSAALLVNHDMEGNTSRAEPMWHLPFRQRSRCRELRGSSIGAALSALLQRHEIDFLAVTARPAPMASIAIATQTLGGGLLAAPVSAGSDPIFEQNGWLTAADFVKPHSNAFLVATGITNHLALRGVRSHENGMIGVESLCLSMGTGSIRNVRHQFSRHRYKFFVAPPDAGVARAEWTNCSTALRETAELIGREVGQLPPAGPEASATGLLAVEPKMRPPEGGSGGA